MKKSFLLLLTAALLAISVNAGAQPHTYGNPYGPIWDAWSGGFGMGIKPGTGELYFWTISGGGFSIYETPAIQDSNKLLDVDKTGVTSYGTLTGQEGLATPGTFSTTGAVNRIGDSSSDTFDVMATMRVTVFAKSATVINSHLQLSSWSGQASKNGVSILQAEAGKTYEIDLATLSKSLAGMDFSGVTIVGPDATAANDQKPFSVIIIPPTGSTLASLVSGVSPVWVVPYAGSGATSYGANATKPQSMQGDYMDANGVLTAGAIASGASTSFLTKIGDSAEYQTRNNSGVSLFAVKVTKKK